MTKRTKSSQSTQLKGDYRTMSSNRVFSILIVDDDLLVQQSLKLILPKNWKVFSATKIEAIQYERFYHAAFVDMHLEPGTASAMGPQVIEQLSKFNPQLEIVAISGDINRLLMEKSLKAGAHKFLGKPLLAEEVLLILEKIEALWNLRCFEPQEQKRGRAHWVGGSLASQSVLKRVAELRGETNSVLIEGETGTGKEVVARLLHEQEGERPFVAVNLASIPDQLFESEFFGHVKGAFTGADTSRIGLAEAAHGGDLFLDEIEALPLNQQAKLLRFLETGEVRKVGSKESFHVKTRIIAASNKPLLKMVQQGDFREDLLYRLSSQKIELPSLRERSEDIAPLAQHFLQIERPRRNKNFSEDGLRALNGHLWPGNVRELKRVCEQLSLTAPLPIIRDVDVQNWITPKMANPSSASYSVIDFSKGLNKLVEEFEALAIKTCLQQSKDIEDAAKILQVSRSNLYKKIKDYKIEEEESSS